MEAFAQVRINQYFDPIKSGKFDTIGGLVSVILPNVYVLAGLLLLVLMIGGGMAIIAGSAQGDSKKTGEGSSAVTGALIGFLIIFASYWIIQIVEAITGLQIL